MSHARRSTLEKKTQAEIELALGAEPDLLLLRNAIGKARFEAADGREYHAFYGLGTGSPDLVGLLLVGDVAIWFCLEVKADEGDVDPEQMKCHAIWRQFGALIYVVRSVAEARTALANARQMRVAA